jgi:hypothetical protein
VEVETERQAKDRKEADPTQQQTTTGRKAATQNPNGFNKSEISIRSQRHR